jgi:hypothetical protein
LLENNISSIQISPTIIILRERQLLLRVLKLYIVINDTHLYQLKEQEPLVIEEYHLPIKIMAENGFHFSKPLQLAKPKTDPVLIGIGCAADNGTLWGGVIFSALFFMIFFVTHFYAVLILANLPLFYLMYKIFWKPKEFITIEILKK